MLNAGEIQVWRADLDAVDENRLPPLLPQDADRATRFRSEDVRVRFVRSHGVLRSILSGLGLQAVYDRDSMGKPKLVGQSGVHFNLSRSHGKAIYAVTSAAPVGVDIEKLRPLPEYMAVAERFLPPSQYDEFLDAPEETRETDFFRIWARLEASLKALGVGLYGAGAELEGLWTVSDVDAGEGFAAAVAARAPGLRIVVRDFKP
jgi:4'-phosphopantetheinyl transferase